MVRQPTITAFFGAAPRAKAPLSRAANAAGEEVGTRERWGEGQAARKKARRGGSSENARRGGRRAGGAAAAAGVPPGQAAEVTAESRGSADSWAEDDTGGRATSPARLRPPEGGDAGGGLGAALPGTATGAPSEEMGSCDAGSGARANLGLGVPRPGCRSSPRGKHPTPEGPSAAVGAPDPTAPTAYEAERLERIRRNEELLRQLGLEGGGAKPARGPPKAATRARKPARQTPAVPEPRRRSSRLVALEEGKEQGDDDGGTVEEAMRRVSRSAAALESEPAPEFEDSGVGRYVLGTWYRGKGGDESGVREGVGGRIAAVPAATAAAPRLGTQLILEAPSLARIYGMDAHGALVCAAGKGGAAAVWGVAVGGARGPAGDNEGGDDTPVPEAELGEREENGDGEPEALPHSMPLLEWKAHAGWACDAVFLATDDGGGPTAGSVGGIPRVATSGNDGTVRLWDVSEASCGRGGSRTPREIGRLEAPSRSSVFGMHAWRAGDAGGCRLALATRSGAVAAVQAGSAEELPGARLRVWEDAHAGVARCVRWSGCGNFLASCGDDGAVRVWEVAAGCGAGPVVEWTAPNGLAVEAVRWEPARPGGDAPASRLLLAHSRGGGPSWVLEVDLGGRGRGPSETGGEAGAPGAASPAPARAVATLPRAAAGGPRAPPPECPAWTRPPRGAGASHPAAVASFRATREGGAVLALFGPPEPRDGSRGEEGGAAAVPPSLPALSRGALDVGGPGHLLGPDPAHPGAIADSGKLLAAASKRLLVLGY